MKKQWASSIDTKQATNVRRDVVRDNPLLPCARHATEPLQRVLRRIHIHLLLTHARTQCHVCIGMQRLRGSNGTKPTLLREHAHRESHRERARSHANGEPEGRREDTRTDARA